MIFKVIRKKGFGLYWNKFMNTQYIDYPHFGHCQDWNCFRRQSHPIEIGDTSYH